ncbi:MAG: Adaptive-response sensory-kinase SasA [Candidatus Omnitrophica bacterium]|nr:Adaptive-response sensory-kinase SasA [Candidatus Omnitrophota bacterium]
MKVHSHILIVSRDPVLVSELTYALESDEYGFAVRQSAEEALARLREGTEDDLIVLDADLGRNESEGFLQLLQEDPATAPLPVLIVSSDPDWHRIAVERNLADFLPKPADVGAALVKIDTILRLTIARQILEERAKLDDVLDVMTDGILILDTALRITRINVAAKRLFGQGAVPGARFFDALSGVFPAASGLPAPGDLAEDALAFDIERPETPQSRPLILEVRTHPVLDQFRKVTAIVVILSDVTERRRKAFQEEQFLDLISHKLRTPLSIAHKNASMFVKGVLGTMSADQSKFMTTLYEKISELADSVEKILGFTVVRARKFEVADDPIALDDYLSGRLELYAKRQWGREVLWRLELLEKGLHIRMGRRHLDLIVNNLIENAIKFNDKAQVHVTVYVESFGDRIELRVRDDGPGIPPEEQEKIFEEFYQVDKYRTLNVAGTGLGLTIARRLARAYGGDILVRSMLGKGSIFIVTLARVEPPAKENP